MTIPQFTHRAEADLDQMSSALERLTGRTGLLQFLQGFEAMCRSAMEPLTGQSCDALRPGYRVVCHGDYAAFYRRTRTGTVLFVRVLRVPGGP